MGRKHNPSPSQLLAWAVFLSTCIATALSFRGCFGPAATRTFLCRAQRRTHTSQAMSTVDDPFDVDASELDSSTDVSAAGLADTLSFSLPTTSYETDLWVAGAGTLGELLVGRYIAAHPTARVVGETLSSRRASVLMGLGAIHSLRHDRREANESSSKNVVIAFPSGAERDPQRHLEEVEAASLLWAGPAARGKLVIVSSTGIYGDESRPVDEESEFDMGSIRSTLLYEAEQIVLEAGGYVMRFGGLYNVNRGPHVIYLRRMSDGSILDSSSRATVNLIHYEDAADILMKLLEMPNPKQRIFVGVDDTPIEKQEILSIAAQTLNMRPIIPPMFAFDMPIGKVINSNATRAALDWKPRYASFRHYFEEASGK